MYFAAIILLMGALPIASIVIEFVARSDGLDLSLLIGKWFVFWSVGARLILTGLRQASNPAFTAETIFGARDASALPIVRELGFGNLSIGLIGALALIQTKWIVPAAVAGGLFYGLAGIGHLLRANRNGAENMAMVSDFFIVVVLAGFLTAVSLGAG